MTEDELRKEVSQPDHYTGTAESVDVIRQQFGDKALRHAALVQAFQYIFRCMKKGSLEKDIRKAIWWLHVAVGDDPRNKEVQ